MTSEPAQLPPDRQQLVERAADWRCNHPHTPTPVVDLIDEFGLSVAEAVEAVRLAGRYRTLRSAMS